MAQAHQALFACHALFSGHDVVLLLLMLYGFVFHCLSLVQSFRYSMSPASCYKSHAILL